MRDLRLYRHDTAISLGNTCVVYSQVFIVARQVYVCEESLSVSSMLIKQVKKGATLKPNAQSTSSSNPSVLIAWRHSDGIPLTCHLVYQ